ncbi:MAG: RNA methyltransferase [Alistipes sp.]|nr:RNA methyltransferase [Candidatus Alistipes equi]
MTHSQIQEIHSLDDKKQRDALGLFKAEGEKLVGELLSSRISVKSVYQTEEIFEQGVLISQKEMSRISSLKTATKVLAVAEKPKYSLSNALPEKALILALDGVQNPGNIGTIIRLADWFGINDIVCSPQCADVFGPKVVQAAMGATFRVRVHYTDLVSFLLFHKSVPVYGTFLDGEDIYSATLSRNGIIVMGNEGQGISQEVAKKVNRRLFIPPYPKNAHTSESLNVAIATSIVCSEFRRR